QPGQFISPIPFHQRKYSWTPTPDRRLCRRRARPLQRKERPAVPYINDALTAHPALPASIAAPRGAGVTVLDLHPRPQPDNLPWERILDALS
ncbi:MAG TPA: hypothetical protein VNW94_13995, partial [Streptosporangiaceae bacterium]|nr:hypothetical protein [Streptosporangiaceae bacterium]